MPRYRSHKEGVRARIKACECAAVVLSTRRDEEALVPLAFSLAVFFEAYIAGGANATAKDFGPKEPIELKKVTNV